MDAGPDESLRRGSGTMHGDGRSTCIHDCSNIAERELIWAGAHSPLVVIFGHFLLGGRACVGMLSVLPMGGLSDY